MRVILGRLGCVPATPDITPDAPEHRSDQKSDVLRKQEEWPGEAEELLRDRVDDESGDDLQART